MQSDHILYILVRNDLPSMNAGKAMAQASHASNAFIHDMSQLFTDKSKLKGTRQLSTEAWQSQTKHGFGTVIVLSANKAQLDEAVKEANVANVIIDPTYPYIVNSELAGLVDPALHTVPPIFKNDGNVVLHRKETTCGYVFGTKEECKSAVGHLPLHP